MLYILLALWRIPYSCSKLYGGGYWKLKDLGEILTHLVHRVKQANVILAKQTLAQHKIEINFLSCTNGKFDTNAYLLHQGKFFLC